MDEGLSLADLEASTSVRPKELLNANPDDPKEFLKLPPSRLKRLLACEAGFVSALGISRMGFPLSSLEILSNKLRLEELRGGLGGRDVGASAGR